MDKCAVFQVSPVITLLNIPFWWISLLWGDNFRLIYLLLILIAVLIYTSIYLRWFLFPLFLLHLLIQIFLSKELSLLPIYYVLFNYSLSVCISGYIVLSSKSLLFVVMMLIMVAVRQSKIIRIKIYIFLCIHRKQKSDMKFVLNWLNFRTTGHLQVSQCHVYHVWLLIFILILLIHWLNQLLYI